MVPFLKRALTFEAVEARYTKVPAFEFGKTVTVTTNFPAAQNPDVTWHGRTEVPIKLRLEAQNGEEEVAGKTVRLSSSERQAAGAERIAFPDTLVTDTQGEARFTLVVDELWLAQPGFDTITLRAVLAEDATVTARKEVVLIDNLAQVVDFYQRLVPRGVIWENTVWDVVRRIVPLAAEILRRELEWKSWAGHVNNTLDSLFWLLAPPEYKYLFALTTCGGYQATVLNLMQDLHRNLNAYGRTDWFLNGLDYGPIFESGGLHVAAMVYPRLTDGRRDWMSPHTIILDPWLEQEPVAYPFNDWLARLTDKNMNLTPEVLMALLVSPYSVGMALLGDNAYNDAYPANGHDYVVDARRVGSSPGDRPATQLLVNCPVRVTIEDNQGRQSGFLPDAPPGTLTLVDQIPGVRRSLVTDSELGSHWYFELPDQPLTITLRPYGAGTMDLQLTTPDRFLAFASVSLAGETAARMALVPAAAQAPTLRFADGRQVAAQASLTLPPRLRMARQGRALVLSWSEAQSGCRLQTADHPAATVWTDLAATNQSAVVEATGNARYFRLVRP